MKVPVWCPCLLLLSENTSVVLSSLSTNIRRGLLCLDPLSYWDKISPPPRTGPPTPQPLARLFHSFNALHHTSLTLHCRFIRASFALHLRFIRASNSAESFKVFCTS